MPTVKKKKDTVRFVADKHDIGAIKVIGNGETRIIIPEHEGSEFGVYTPQYWPPKAFKGKKREDLGGVYWYPIKKGQKFYNEIQKATHQIEKMKKKR